MLRVARVAMIDGIFTPRTRPALTRPTPTPQRRIAPAPSRMAEVVDPAPIRNEARTTPKTDHRPHREIDVPDQKSVGLGHGGHHERGRQEEDLRTLVTFTNPGNRELVYQTNPTQEQNLKSHRHPEPDPDDLAPLLARGHCGRPCGPVASPDVENPSGCCGEVTIVMRKGRVPRQSKPRLPWASPRRRESGRPSTGPVRGRSPR